MTENEEGETLGERVAALELQCFQSSALVRSLIAVLEFRVLAAGEPSIVQDMQRTLDLMNVQPGDTASAWVALANAKSDLDIIARAVEEAPERS